MSVFIVPIRIYHSYRSLIFQYLFGEPLTYYLPIFLNFVLDSGNSDSHFADVTYFPLIFLTETLFCQISQNFAGVLYSPFSPPLRAPRFVITNCIYILLNVLINACFNVVDFVGKHGDE